MSPDPRPLRVTRGQPHRSLLIGLLASLTAAACTLSPEGKTACEDSSDCIAGFACVEQVCIAEMAYADVDASAARIPEPSGDGATEGGTDTAPGMDAAARMDAATTELDRVDQRAMDGGLTGPMDGAAGFADGAVEANDARAEADSQAPRDSDSDVALPDADPCAVNNGGCGEIVSCSNEGGVAVCGKCPLGYRGPLCTDFDECGTASDTCDSDPPACVNEPGTFRCECHAGFVGTGIGSNGCSRRVEQLAAGSAHTCARFLEDGAVKCWGSNDRGQLGLGDTVNRGDDAGEMGDALPAIDLGTGRSAVRVAAGRKHTCALLDDGSVKCWGDNSYGQLGQGTSCLLSCGTPGEVLDHRGDTPGEMGDKLTSIRLGSGRTALEITAGDDFSCALLDDWSVKCWGANQFGQLGLGTSCLSGCTTAPVYDHRGDQQGEMGDALAVVSLGTGRAAVRLQAGGSHACALLDDGAVRCWGRNASGQLGTGDLNDRGDGPGEMGESLKPVLPAAGVQSSAFVAGAAHTCTLLENDALKCWGNNDAGQLGLGNTVMRAGSTNDPAVELGSARRVSMIACGGAHCCAVLTDSALKCWGSNDAGQLGLGDQRSRGGGPGEMGDDLPSVPLAPSRVVSVAAGDRHTCVLFGDRSVRCFGSNAQGQLGLGGTDNLGDDLADLDTGAPVLELGR